MKLNAVPVLETTFESLKATKDAYFYEAVFYIAEDYTDNYLFSPADLPIQLYGTMLFGMASEGFKGAYTCYTPYNGSTLNIKHLIRFIEYIDEPELLAALKHCERKLEQFNQSDIASHDRAIIDNKKIEDAIHAIVWDNKVCELICSERLSQKVQELFWKNPPLFISSQQQLNDWLIEQIDAIPNYWERIKSSGSIFAEVKELLYAANERYMSYSSIYYSDGPFRLLKVQTTKGMRFVACYKDALELRDLQTGQQLAWIDKPELRSNVGAQHRISYEEAKLWRYDTKENRVILPPSIQKQAAPGQSAKPNTPKGFKGGSLQSYYEHLEKDQEFMERFDSDGALARRYLSLRGGKTILFANFARPIDRDLEGMLEKNPDLTSNIEAQALLSEVIEIIQAYAKRREGAKQDLTAKELHAFLKFSNYKHHLDKFEWFLFTNKKQLSPPKQAPLTRKDRLKQHYRSWYDHVLNTLLPFRVFGIDKSTPAREFAADIAERKLIDRSYLRMIDAAINELERQKPGKSPTLGQVGEVFTNSNLDISEKQFYQSLRPIQAINEVLAVLLISIIAAVLLCLWRIPPLLCLTQAAIFTVVGVLIMQLYFEIWRLFGKFEFVRKHASDILFICILICFYQISKAVDFDPYLKLHLSAMSLIGFGAVVSLQITVIKRFLPGKYPL
ncbi:hypothetical protein O5O45_08480 [Hahella aquimaris]|uniref:hypothetical protein n=1 Tax=Hahella sp. HNIBRBA332 TaxID=3015983 RepID=UPI00273AB04F|nr:hypothetical protein [Hahella sp. HNIBRBA332]WLQ15950.1 hypothetical protein O5O45_08480 [Hahella sp. HNIBRBA332]